MARVNNITKYKDCLAQTETSVLQSTQAIEEFSKHFAGELLKIWWACEFSFLQRDSDTGIIQPSVTRRDHGNKSDQLGCDLELSLAVRAQANFHRQRVEGCLMSISKRSMIFVFAIVTAFSFIVHDREAVAQNFTGLDMPEVYYQTQRPYQPTLAFTKDEKAQKKAFRLKVQAWTKENSDALKAIRAGESKVRDLLASGGDATTDAEAKKFLEEYAFPSMTQTDPDTLSLLGEKRENFLKNYLNERVTGNARAKMIDFSIDKLQGYAVNESLHPSARVNAIVLISQLTDRPLIRGRQAPVASANALNSLLNIFKGQDPKKFPEFVNVAALSGIKYQLDLNSKSGQTVDSGVQAQLVDAAMKLMAAPADRKADAAAYWNKRQAVQLSAVLKDAKTLPALLAILNDEKASHDLRLEVVKTLIKTGAMGNDPKTNNDVLVSICKFAETSVANEATHLETEVRQMIRKGMLYANKDLAAKGTNFGPGDPQASGGSGNRGSGNRNDFGTPGGFDNNPTPMVELPNYQLGISRNRIRAIAEFSRQAIGVDKEDGLRPNLDAKAEALARGTVSQLNSLFSQSNIGMLDQEKKTIPGRPSDEELDEQRKTSYADQMTKAFTKSAEALGKLVSNFTTEG